MAEIGIDALLLSVGPDLPYFTGYEAMPLERLTMLVLPRTGDIQLVVPGSRRRASTPAGAVRDRDVGRDRRSDRAGAGMIRRSARRVAIGDHTWARFVLDLQHAVPSCVFVARDRGRRPDPHGQGRRRDRGAHPRRARGRRDRGRDAQRRVRGPHRARRAPRAGRADARRRARARELRDRRRRRATPRARTTNPPRRVSSVDGDIVLCDFGGTMDGYCSDITRMFHVGEPPAEVARRLRGAGRRAGSGRARGDGRHAVRRTSTPRPGP